jgi:hypothetical protein
MSTPAYQALLFSDIDNLYQVARFQGLRSPYSGVDEEAPIFGEDVLTIEQCSTELANLTLIDVPGKGLKSLCRTNPPPKPQPQG